MYGPRVRNNNTEDHANGGRFDNRTETFIEIHIGLLGVAAKNPTGFMASERTIRLNLCLKIHLLVTILVPGG